jgi:hypothetical protein
MCSGFNYSGLRNFQVPEIFRLLINIRKIATNARDKFAYKNLLDHREGRGGVRSKGLPKSGTHLQKPNAKTSRKTLSKTIKN